MSNEGQNSRFGLGTFRVRCTRGVFSSACLRLPTGILPDGDKLDEFHISGSGGDGGSTAYCGVAPLGLGMGLGPGSGSGSGLGLD